MLVVEVGGTTLRAARFDPQRRVLCDRRTADTPNHCAGGSTVDLQERVLAAIAQLAGEVFPDGSPDVAAVAYPGPVDAEGRVLAAPTVLGRSGDPPFPLREACAALWPGAATLVVNDLTAAGYRYVGAGLRDFAILTIGSGIGHKVFLDGAPLLGPAARGGEIGHLRLDFSSDAPVCDCGGRGHLGGLGSGRGTVARVRRRAAAHPAAFQASLLGSSGVPAERLDGPAVAAGYLAADPFTTAAVGEAVRYLGQGLAAIHLDTGVERFLLVGGFARALGDRYRAQAAEAAAAASWQVGQDWDRMVDLGEPDDDSALLGAGLLAAGLLPAGAAG